MPISGGAARVMRVRMLYAIMALEERNLRPRTIPSAFTLLKAEFGMTGTRAQVYLQAQEMARDKLDDQVPSS